MEKVVVQTKTDMASENSFENFKVKYETIKSTLISKELEIKGVNFQQSKFSKGLTKLAILPDYKGARLLCLTLPTHQKKAQF